MKSKSRNSKLSVTEVILLCKCAILKLCLKSHSNTISLSVSKIVREMEHSYKVHLQPIHKSIIKNVLDELMNSVNGQKLLTSKGHVYIFDCGKLTEYLLLELNK